MTSHSFGTRLRLVCVVSMAAGVMAFAPSVAASSPVGHAQIHGIRVIVPDPQFTSFECNGTDVLPAPVCDVTMDGAASSRLTGDGNFHLDAVVTFFNGFNDACNHVDENATFTFHDGTFTTKSSHTDCNLTGVRVNTRFVVTGGTGRYAGARGFGIELEGAGAFPPLQYDGLIFF